MYAPGLRDIISDSLNPLGEKEESELAVCRGGDGATTEIILFISTLMKTLIHSTLNQKMTHIPIKTCFIKMTINANIRCGVESMIFTMQKRENVPFISTWAGFDDGSRKGFWLESFLSEGFR